MINIKTILCNNSFVSKILDFFTKDLEDEEGNRCWCCAFWRGALLGILNGASLILIIPLGIIVFPIELLLLTIYILNNTEL
ncbi:MAG: hypothetical protein [Caudoviricetes sp.]|nr:MAG: hypothetical protein [Caudoviricetes sp.]